ncbi:MAG TPA: hypothetical protein DEQ24_03700, partial [Enterococcus sp.]|nr:hypothetical protein [Enterococcus sp.]
HPYPSILRKKVWIENQVVSSLATVYQALDDDDLFFDYIKLLGKSKMSDDHEKLANEFKNNEISKRMIKNEMKATIKSISNSSPSCLTEFWYDHESKNGILKLQEVD